MPAPRLTPEIIHAAIDGFEAQSLHSFHDCSNSVSIGKPGRRMFCAPGQCVPVSDQIGQRSGQDIFDSMLRNSFPQGCDDGLSNFGW